MDSSSIAIMSGVIVLAGGILTALNHKHIRTHLKSKCCDKESEIDIQIDGSPGDKMSYQEPDYKVKISDRPILKINSLDK
jgi:hypothetical protein